MFVLLFVFVFVFWLYFSSRFCHVKLQVIRLFTVIMGY